MSTCLQSQTTNLPDTLGDGGFVTATVFTLAASQPPSVALADCAYVLVDGGSASELYQASLPFDYVLAGSFWTFAFSFTIALWFFAKNLGLILEAIKRW
jgi:hypothetical protein